MIWKQQQQKNQYANIIPGTYLYLMKMFHSRRFVLAVVLLFMQTILLFLFSRFIVSSASYTMLVLLNKQNIKKTSVVSTPKQKLRSFNGCRPLFILLIV